MADSETDDAEVERLVEFLEEIGEKLESDPEAAIQMTEQADPELAAHPEVRLVRAIAIGVARGDEEALPELQKIIEEYPDFSDAHAEIAAAYESKGDRKRMIEHLLEVRRLDSEQDKLLGFDPSEYEPLIVDTARRTIGELPPQFRKLIENVPILLEDRPSVDLVQEGFDPRALGLFDGANHEHHSDAKVVDAPTRIVLYTANLTASCEDTDELAEQVEITVLHEIGHYFGLEEHDMERLGLA
jgi:predicted Zn-dependent protease with MMP-like domain